MGLSRLSDLITSWASTLAADSAIQAWAQATYTKPATVYLGQSVKGLPTEATCPLIVLFEGDMTEGNEAETEMSVRIGLCVSNPVPTTTGNLVSYDGLVELHELADLVVEALSDPTDEHRVVSVSHDFQGSEFYPMWPATLEFVVRTWDA